MTMRWLFAALFAAVLCAAGALAWNTRGEAQTPTFDAGQVEEIGRIVREYLIANPDVLEEALTALDEKRQRDREAKFQATLEEHGEELFRHPSDFVLGNPDGDVTLVEFFDYNCGYCKRALSDLTALLETDPNLRVVLKEFPILSPGSVEAAKVSLAVAQQGRFFEFHSELLTGRGAADGQRALAIAESLDLDMNRLRSDMAAEETQAYIDATQDLAIALGIDGTPAYVIGETLVPGAIGVDGLREAIAEARSTGAASAPDSAGTAPCEGEATTC